MTDHELEVVEKMEKYGGSFVKSLAQCFHHADPLNVAKLKICFSDYWHQYENFGGIK